MLVVRLPSGLTLIYQRAHCFEADTNGTVHLYDNSRNKAWITSILPNGCVIEAEPPRSSYNALTGPADAMAATLTIARASRGREHANARQWRELKRALRRFDARRGQWQ